MNYYLFSRLMFESTPKTLFVMKISEKFIPNELGIAAICNRKGFSERTHALIIDQMENLSDNFSSNFAL